MDEMTEGRPIIARMPNNTEKVFIPERRNGILAMQTYSLRAHLDKQTPGALKDLYKGLDKVDPWFVKSSKEFKAVQSTMEKLQKKWRAMGPNPTEYQRDRLREQMKELDTACNAYIEAKNKKGELNDRDKERLAAVKNVSKFAKQQLFEVGILTEQAKKRENAAEREAFQQANSEEAREERQGPTTYEDERERILKVALYSNNAGNAFRQLALRISVDLREMRMDDYVPTSLSSDQKVRCADTMAKMVLLDILQKEHLANGFQKNGDQLGPFETMLNQEKIPTKGAEGGFCTGRDMLLNKIKESPDFQNEIKNLTSDDFNRFVANRHARQLSQKVLPQMFPSKKSAEKAPAKETIKQKTVEAAPKKPTLG